MQKSLSSLKKLSNKESLNKYNVNFIDSSFGGWKIDENTTKFLGRIIETFKPENVLEFGSGTSTLLFANEIKKGNIKKLWSIDHLDDFPEHPRKQIEKLNIKDKIIFKNYKIRPQTYKGKLINFYKIDKKLFNKVKKIDLLFIDGPPYYFFAREAALYSCFDYLSDNSIIILDDAIRNNYEKVFINNWNFIYDKNIQIDIYTDNYEKGLCVILKKNSSLKTKKFSLSHKISYSFNTLSIVTRAILKKFIKN